MACQRTEAERAVELEADPKIQPTIQQLHGMLDRGLDMAMVPLAGNDDSTERHDYQQNSNGFARWSENSFATPVITAETVRRL